MTRTTEDVLEQCARAIANAFEYHDWNKIADTEGDCTSDTGCFSKADFRIAALAIINELAKVENVTDEMVDILVTSFAPLEDEDINEAYRGSIAAALSVLVRGKG